MSENTSVSRFTAARKNFVRFVKDVRVELKKVIWPTRQQLVNNTITVMLYCLVIGAIIWIADEGLTKLLKLTILR